MFRSYSRSLTCGDQHHFQKYFSVRRTMCREVYYRYYPVGCGVLMSLIKFFSGSIFSELLEHGRELEQAITRNDESLLACSTPELERYFDTPPASLPRQNGFPLAIVMFLLLMAFAFNVLVFLSNFTHLTPAEHALSFFVPAIVMLVTSLVCVSLASRGYVAGITCLSWLFVVLVVLTVGQGLRGLFWGGGGQWAVCLAFVALCAARWIFNCQAFVLFILYCRTRRMATLVRQLRQH